MSQTTSHELANDKTTFRHLGVVVLVLVGVTFTLIGLAAFVSSTL